jgi:hypothetical protein
MVGGVSPVIVSSHAFIDSLITVSAYVFIDWLIAFSP